MYGAGEANYTALLTAQQTYSQPQINYLDAVRMLRIAEVEIDGLLLKGSLQSMLATTGVNFYSSSTNSTELLNFRGR
jgi:outer membrane protein TolC